MNTQGKHINKFGWKKRTDVIFDQLNPEYSKYYKKNEIVNAEIDALFSKNEKLKFTIKTNELEKVTTLYLDPLWGWMIMK